MTFLQALHARLESLAYKLTENFCYSCYKVVEGDRCPSCFTDDFMRHLDGVGVEYGTEWVIGHLIEQHCTPVDNEEAYAELLDEIYDEVKIGYSTFSPSQIIKELEPVTFRIGASEMLDDPDRYYEHNGNYYEMADIESMLDDLE